MLTMYDTATANFSTVPADAEAIAPYMDGDFNNLEAARSRFPRLFAEHHVLTLTCRANNAGAVDWEPGNTNPDPAAWYGQQHGLREPRPCFYADLSDTNGTIIPRLNAIGLKMGKAGSTRPVRLLTAHPTQHPHICGPGTCGLLPVDADGTQYWWSSVARSNADIDISLVRDDFFGPAKPSPHYDWYLKVKIGHRQYDEQAIVRRYDKLRDKPLAKILPERPELYILRAECGMLADRIARVALYDPETGRKRDVPEWGRFHRGFRFQGLRHRSEGKRVA